MNGKMHNGARLLFLASLVLAGVVLIVQPGAGAAAGPVDLGTAGAFAVLGGQSVTNTGPSVINGDLGVSPGSSVTGFPPGLVNGTNHPAVPGTIPAQAQDDLTTAYNVAAGQAPDFDLTGQDLGGQTLVPGVYKFDSSAQLTGALTLDAQGDPESVFIFQIGSTLTTASDSAVLVINGPLACGVVWQVGSSATLGTTTTFVGNVLALTSITAVTGTSVAGRLLARNGSVTLDTNVVTPSTCVPTTTSTTATGGGATPSSTFAGGGATTTTAPGGSTTSSTLTGGGATATTSAIALSATTTPGRGAPTNTTATTARGGGPTTNATTAGRTGNSTPGVVRQTVGSGTALPGTTSGATSAKLPGTGGRSPLITLALGLLVLVAGINLQIVSRVRPTQGTHQIYR
jgi:hypothetical protein